ncbi:hypothetical protein GGS23DRAFT_592645 [Durotheca rogersii]|uniref:uncharacterized protein n=1 Tax=Durotheca rogersii TaxID=419775 RepID=UPI002220E7D4|nr:uncharacterized protein GGS23DRAFT_592645 [Durotheca rogersii]KAI5867323.1 hypothetical protein GGS23DRAFT_592645 [Durotheca rogersii]
MHDEFRFPPGDVSTPPTDANVGGDDVTTVSSSIAGLFRTVGAHDGDFVVFQEVVNGRLRALIYRDLNSIGLSEEDLEPFSATEFVSGSDSSGEPDACFMPSVRGSDPNGWPTLVIETGVTQLLRSLHRKMRWWFAASNHTVEIVLLVKVSRASRTLLLEKHIKGVSQTLRQVVTIAPHPSSNPVMHDVMDGPLILEFSLLFLQPADPARGGAGCCGGRRPAFKASRAGLGPVVSRLLARGY